MEPSVMLEIVPSGNNGWDVSKAKTIIFKKKTRAEFFSMYYTKNHDCLIRYYACGMWVATYCKGQLIWYLD